MLGSSTREGPRGKLRISTYGPSRTWATNRRERIVDKFLKNRSQMARHRGKDSRQRPTAAGPAVRRGMMPRRSSGWIPSKTAEPPETSARGAEGLKKAVEFPAFGLICHSRTSRWVRPWFRRKAHAPPTINIRRHASSLVCTL